LQSLQKRFFKGTVQKVQLSDSSQFLHRNKVGHNSDHPQDRRARLLLRAGTYFPQTQGTNGGALFGKRADGAPYQADSDSLCHF
jgi:hypothetical protein